MQRISTLLIALLAATTLCSASAADEVVRAADRVAQRQPANLTRTSILLKGATPLVLGAFQINGDGRNGAIATMQPGVAVWNADGGEMLLDRQINVPPSGNFTTATANAGHDAPSLVETATGGVLTIYGAVSTYPGYHPPAAWQCFGKFACEPFKFADASHADEHIVDELAQSPEYLLPTVGLSEASYATIGDATIIAGQQQPGGAGGEPGAQAYVAFHADAGGGTFDTTAGPWNFRSSHEPPGWGVQTITLTPPDDAYADFAVMRADSGPGSVTLGLAGENCSLTINSNGDAASAAAQIAQAFPSACAALRGRFHAVQVRHDSEITYDGRQLAPAVVGITTTDRGPLPAASVTCSGAIACGTSRGSNTILIERGSGLHRHFLFGGVLRSGPYVYYLMDVEEVTGNWETQGENSDGLALACFRTGAPSGAQWTWTDCAGSHPFALAPGMHPTSRLDPQSPYLIHAPRSGYHGGMAPYVFDWSMHAQAVGGIPVIAAVSAALLPNGNLLLAHGCKTTSGGFGACYALYDTRNGATQSAGTIDSPPVGSLASIALMSKSDGTVEAGILAGEGDRWGCGAVGTCFLTFRYNAYQDSWIPLARTPFGGNDVAGFPGSLNVSGDRFVFQLHRKTSAGYSVETQIRS